MDKCVSCGRTEEEVRLFDGLSVGMTAKICEKCSLIGGVPIIKRPSTGQLKDSEKPFGVRDRLSRMAHIPGEEKKEKSIYEQLKEIENKPELEQPDKDEDLVFKLVDNFKWVIMTERRRKGITQNQLADTLGESLSAIMMLEKGIVPSKSINLIRGIEQLLKIKLIKRDFIEQIEEQKKKESGNILKMEANPSVLNERTEEIPKKLPSKELPIALPRREADNFKIRDLQRLNEKIEKDFSYEKKSKEEVGKEQVENIGKEDLSHLKKTVMKDSFGSKPKSEVPTIYDLMKKKEDRDKSLVGKEIILAEENKKSENSGKTTVNWEDLE